MHILLLSSSFYSLRYLVSAGSTSEDGNSNSTKSLQVLSSRHLPYFYPSKIVELSILLRCFLARSLGCKKSGHAPKRAHGRWVRTEFWRVGHHKTHSSPATRYAPQDPSVR